MDLPRRVLFRVTSKCNKACPECFLRAMPRRPDLTWDQYQRALQRIKEVGLHLDFVILTGGEPTLWPSLEAAVILAKQVGIARRVRVLTNAVGDHMDLSLFGPADSIEVTHYGAENRLNFLKLKRQGGRRVRIRHVVHVPSATPERPAEDTLPAQCSCVGMFCANDKVYPCSMAGQYDVNGCSIEDDFVMHLQKLDVFNQEICRRCFANRKARQACHVPFTIELGIWESEVGLLWSVPWRFEWARRIYRWYLRWR